MDTMNKLAKKMISGLLCLCYALGADGQTRRTEQIAVNKTWPSQSKKTNYSWRWTSTSPHSSKEATVKYCSPLRSPLKTTASACPPYASRGATVITTTCDAPHRTALSQRRTRFDRIPRDGALRKVDGKSPAQRHRNHLRMFATPP